MKRSQMIAMQERGAKARRELFGLVTIEYDNGRFTVPGYHSPIARKQKMELVGYLAPHDCIVRIPKACGFTPEIGKFLRIIFPDSQPAVKMRITEFPQHGAGTEWALGCDSVL